MFDTTVLVAASLPTHPHFQECHHWLDAAIVGRMGYFVAARSLAESYRVLTAMQHQPPLSSQWGLQVLNDNVILHASIVSLDASEYIGCLQRIASAGHRSGIIYDALIVEAALKANVDKLLTLNDRHFTRVWPNYSNEVINPLTTQAP